MRKARKREGGHMEAMYMLAQARKFHIGGVKKSGFKKRKENFY